ncbi:MAG TPA: hypothetical protein VF469_14650, partial [Kofleriaceae bacterium]
MAVPRILTLALWCAAASAWASPRTDPTTGRAVFTGATLPHATSIELDPAALGLGTFNQLYVALTGTLDQLHVDLDRLDGNRLVPGPRVRDVEMAPGAMLAFIYHLAGDSFTLGFDAHLAPPETFPSNPALSYLVSGGSEQDWQASAGVSYKATGDLFFGASLSHQNTFLRLRYARDTALDSAQGPNLVPCNGAPCGIGNPAAAEGWNVDVRSPIFSTSNLRVNIGALYQVTHDVWLAVAYHTPPGLGVESELAGRATIDRAPRDVAADPELLPRICGPSVVPQICGQSVVDIQFPASVDAELRARLPAQLDLHLAGRWEDLSRMSTYDVRTYGTTLPSHGIPEWTERPRGMHDAFAFWGGVEQVDHGEQVRLGARLGFETSAVTPSRTSPLTVSPASATLDLGVQLRIAHGLIAQLSYGLQYFPKVNATGSEFDPRWRADCTASDYDYSTAACAAVRNGYAIATAAGTYDRIEHALRLGLR